MDIGIIRVAREGLPYILAFLILTIVLGIFFPYLAILSLLVLSFVTFFFRDPQRRIPQDPLAVISAADGKVVGIDEISEPYYLKGNVKRVSIFLSIFDVHINRSPFQGKVEYIKYSPGKFHNAMEGKSSIFNEHNLVGIQTSNTRILVKQIAGMIARRIVCYCHPGDSVYPGDKIGLIKFGSRVEIFVPLNTDILVKLGQKVKGGETIIGRLPE